MRGREENAGGLRGRGEERRGGDPAKMKKNKEMESRFQ